MRSARRCGGRDERAALAAARRSRFAHRELLCERFAKHSITYRFIEAQADDATVKQRLRSREDQPDEVSDARLEDFEMLAKLYEPPTELPASRCPQIQTSTPLNEAVTTALKSLSQIEIGILCQSP